MLYLIYLIVFLSSRNKNGNLQYFRIFVPLKGVVVVFWGFFNSQLSRKYKSLDQLLLFFDILNKNFASGQNVSFLKNSRIWLHNDQKKTVLIKTPSNLRVNSKCHAFFKCSYKMWQMVPRSPRKLTEREFNQEFQNW